MGAPRSPAMTTSFTYDAACLINFLRVQACGLLSCCCSMCRPAGWIRTATVFLGSEVQMDAPLLQHFAPRYTVASCVQVGGRLRILTTSDTSLRWSLVMSDMTVTRRGQLWGCSKAMSFGSVSLMTVTLARYQVLMLVQDAASVLQPCGGNSSASLGAACRMSNRV